MSLFRRKSIDAAGSAEGAHALHRSLSWPHLMALGVGAIIGSGIFTLIGVGVGLAGPGVLVSFALVGVVCACAALAYAEMAATVPASGSAYTYSYVVLGELIAWVIGWSLVLEYSLVVSAVAVGWSGYAVGFWNALAAAAALPMAPEAITVGPHAGGIVNLPAIFITAIVTGLLLLGTRESATVNAVLVVIKLLALAAFVAIAAPHFDPARLEPLAPYGWGKTAIEGAERGVLAAASIIFFAFYGFDALSTAAEETKAPGRDLPIGIIGSMMLCTLIYIVVAAAAVGAVDFRSFANSPEPLALILRAIGSPGAAGVIAGAAVLTFPTVLLAFLYGQTRVFFVMARDGLLPRGLARVSGRGVPVAITLVTAVAIAALAGVARIDEIAALANAGTLAAFIAVAACMLVLRVRDPKRQRAFRAPLGWLVGLGAIGGCLYLFWGLPTRTQLWFLLWNAIGLVVYFAYARRSSALTQSA
jgi:APA family basic amino acid/polyamine antiporter